MFRSNLCRFLIVSSLMSVLQCSCLLVATVQAFSVAQKTTVSKPSTTSIASSSSSSESAVRHTTTVPSFVSPNYQVFIEDTDAYGVMYNANYLRCYDRALHSVYTQQDNIIFATNGDDSNNQGGEQRQSILDTHEDWAIVHVENQKFKSSPKLGGMYCIHGTLVDHDDENGKEIWDVTLQESEEKDSTLFNAARVTIARPGVFATPSKVLAKHVPETMTTHKDLFRLFRDEFDVHFPTHIPLRNVLNLFERSRSNFLGGPDCLRRLQEEHRLLFVVTKVDNLCKFPSADGNESNLKPGQMVLVQTDFEVKRKGMIMECHHTLKANKRPVAQATVTLMTLDADSFKPSTNLPGWLWEILQEE